MSAASRRYESTVRHCEQQIKDKVQEVLDYFHDQIGAPVEDVYVRLGVSDHRLEDRSVIVDFVHMTIGSWPKEES